MTWIKKRKKYSKPRKLYDKIRIEEENELVKKYGLKNKREIWKADSAVERIRSQAKKLITSSQEEQKKLIKKLSRLGFKVEKIADILALKKEDWLKRRLQSVLIARKKVKPREARQLIAHKHVSINREIVNIPSYLVKVDEEDKIEIIKRGKAKGNLQEIKNA
ncbi:MAG: 30S ribosomal protein S4 [Nanoarchaeota archaeon]